MKPATRHSPRVRSFPTPIPEVGAIPNGPQPHLFAVREIVVKNRAGDVLKEIDARQWAQYGQSDAGVLS